MSARMVTFCVLLTTWLFFPAALKAQAPPQDDSIKALTAAVKQLSAQMVTKKDLANLVTKEQLDAAADAIATNAAGIKSLKDELDRVRQYLDTQIAEQRSILDAIHGRDSSGNPYLNLTSIMEKSPEGRRQVAQAVRDSMPQRGTLRVNNQMATGQYLLVNGRQEYIPAFTTTAIDVAVGTVTTELVGYEGPKNWTVGPPNYVQAIDIKPRPASPVIVGPPAYVSPPVYLGPSWIVW
jgi:hypothetical protein